MRRFINRYMCLMASIFIYLFFFLLVVPWLFTWLANRKRYVFYS